MKLSSLKRFPAVITIIPLITGILISYNFNSGLGAVDYKLIIFIQVIIALISIYFYSGLKANFLKNYIPFFIFVVFFGLMSFQFHYYRSSEQDISLYIDKFKNEDIKLYGILSEQPQISEGRVRLVIKADSVSSSNLTVKTRGNVLANVYKDRYLEFFPGKLEYGNIVELKGKLQPLPPRRNPGEFDYGNYLRLHDIQASFITFGYGKVKSTGDSDSDPFKKFIIYPVKIYSSGIIDSLIGGSEGEFLKGLVLGERSNISKEMKEDFINAGVAHIIAVSGLNVIYVIIIISSLLLAFPIKYHYKIFIIIIFLIFYMYLTGSLSSIMRATIMASVFLISQLVERKSNAYNLISFSAIIVLLIDPKQLFDPGFILSYSAILSIAFFYPKLNGILLKINYYKKLSEDRLSHKIVILSVILILGTLAAQLGTLPITAIMFRKISLVSVFTNLVVIPVSNIALGIGFLVIISSVFSTFLAGIFAQTASLVLYGLLKFINYFARFDFSFVETYWADVILLIFYYLIILILFSVNKLNYKAKLSIIFLLIINFAVFRPVIDRTNKVKLTYLDVVNSNSCLISLPEGTNVLINAGSSTPAYNSAERTVIPYLKFQGIDYLNLLVLTSLKKDEFRNLKNLIENFPVNKIIIPSFYKPLFDPPEGYFKNTKIEFIDSSGILNKSGKFRLYLFYDDNLYQGRSILAEFVYGKERFVFSDVTDTPEEYLYTPLNTDSYPVRVLKIPPYLWSGFASPEFIIKSNPGYILISSGKNIRRLHNEIFIKTLELTGFKVLNIRERNAVIFETDGHNTRLVDWKR